MTIDVVTRALLVIGAFLLLIGPGLQATSELSEYRNLVRESDLQETVKKTLLAIANPPPDDQRRPWWAVFLASIIEMFVPGGSDLPYLISLSVINGYKQVVASLDTLSHAEQGQARPIATAFRKARNWSLIMLGSLVVLIGSTIDLVHVASTRPSAAGNGTHQKALVSSP